MRHDLSVDQLGDLVHLPLVSTLATYRRDGSVLLSPIWHEWSDGGFNVCAGPSDVKVRHIRRDGRASIVVYDQQRPYRGLELRCGPTLVEDGAAYATVLRRIAIRYLGEGDGSAYADLAGQRGVIIRMEPGDLRTWDFADEEQLNG